MTINVNNVKKSSKQRKTQTSPPTQGRKKLKVMFILCNFLVSLIFERHFVFEYFVVYGGLIYCQLSFFSVTVLKGVEFLELGSVFSSIRPNVRPERFALFNV